MRPSVCLRRLGEGKRPQEVGFGRFLANPKVTVDRLIAGWSDQTVTACAGRHVLAIQDTSEISFHTTTKRRRGLGEIGKGGRPRGLLLHAMLGLDAETGTCLGLAGGQIWNRSGRVKDDHHERRPEAKESHRWVATAEQAKEALAASAKVTVVADRESDIFAVWAQLPAPDFHLIVRVMQDRCLAAGGKLYDAVADFQVAGTRVIDLPERDGKREARTATLHIRYGRVVLAPPAEQHGTGLARWRDIELHRADRTGSTQRCRTGALAALDHPSLARCRGRLADRRLVQDALDYRAVLAAFEAPRAQARGQPDRDR